MLGGNRTAAAIAINGFYFFETYFANLTEAGQTLKILFGAVKETRIAGDFTGIVIHFIRSIVLN